MRALRDICSGLPGERVFGGVSAVPPLIPERLVFYFRNGKSYDMWNRIFCHDSFIMICMISGKRTVNIDDCSYTLEKGELIFIPPYSKHFFGDEYRDFESLMASFVVPGDSQRLINLCARIWKFSRKEDQSIRMAVEPYNEKKGRWKIPAALKFTYRIPYAERKPATIRASPMAYHQPLKVGNALYSSQLPTVLGKGMASRMLPMPVRYMTQRSKPRPKPA